MPFPRVHRSLIAAIVAVSVTLLGSAGCVTTRIDEKPAVTSPPGTARFRVAIYENRSAVKKDLVYSGAVRSRLMRLEPLPAEIVFESAQATWSVEELAPGKYRLDVSRTVAEKQPDSGTKTFKVKAGDIVAARTILYDTRGVMWTCLGVAVVGVGVGVAIAAASNAVSGVKNIKLSAGPRVDELRLSPRP
jgi:hypothetical protein